MEKLVYLAMGSAPALGGQDILAAAARLSADRYRAVSVQLARPDVEAERASVRGAVLSQAQAETASNAGPAVERLLAAVSVWLDCADDRAEVERLAGMIGDRVLGYSVTESVPRWLNDSTQPPPGGVKAFTLMHRNPAMSREQFLDHWYAVHMPMSLRFHPQWSYLRNVVTRTLVGDPTAAPDAIAEEGFASAHDLIDPGRFYGAGDDPELLLANRKTVHADVPVFLDIAATSTFVTEEHVIRAAWTPARGHDPAFAQL